LGGYSHESPTKSCRGRVNRVPPRLKVGCDSPGSAGGLATRFRRIV